MTFQPKTGHKMKLYRNTGTVASPTWSEVDQIGDLSIPDFNMALAELKRRGNNFTKNLPSIIQTIACEFRLHYGLDSTNWDAIRAAFLAGTVEEYAIVDGDIATSGTQGLRVTMIVENFAMDQPLEDVVGNDVRLSIAYFEESSAEVDPSWYTVP